MYAIRIPPVLFAKLGWPKKYYLHLFVICVLVCAPDGFAQQAKTHGAIYAIEVKRPNIVVHGANLAKVELWAAPTGTDITSDQFARLGTAKRRGAAGKNETWVFPIPSQPFLATGIFAKGFDANGKLAGTKSLPYYGASDIHDALWGKSDEKPSPQD